MQRDEIAQLCEPEVLDTAVRLFGTSTDSCYFWFMYDIACAWEGGIGRTMFRPLAERQDFMRRYVEQVLTGYTCENALADDTPIGFILTHTGSDYEDGIDCPGVFLWRFMIGAPWQGKGYGKRALEKLIQHLKAMGIPLLYTSCGQGEGSPEGFYRKLGFISTGDHYDHEIELVLRLGTYPVTVPVMMDSNLD